MSEPLDVERLTQAMRIYYSKGDGHVVPLGLRDKFGLPDIWPSLAAGIAGEYERLSRRCVECGEPWPCTATVTGRRDRIPHRLPLAETPPTDT